MKLFKVIMILENKLESQKERERVSFIGKASGTKVSKEKERSIQNFTQILDGKKKNGKQRKTKIRNKASVIVHLLQYSMFANLN